MRAFYCIVLLISTLGSLIAQTNSATCFVEGEDTVTDIDGNVYKTVKIGEQWWMAQNLRTAHYSDGGLIHFAESYNNEKIMDRVYGKYYNFSSLMKGAGSSNANPSGVQGACPEGWHVPSDMEWLELEAYLGMPKEFRELDGWRGTNMEGARLLDTNYSGFSNGNCTGLSILNSGRVIKEGRNELTGIEVALTGFYLTSTAYEDKKMWGRKFKHDMKRIGRLTFIKHDENGYSCRCVKD